MKIISITEQIVAGLILLIIGACGTAAYKYLQNPPALSRHKLEVTELGIAVSLPEMQWNLLSKYNIDEKDNDLQKVIMYLRHSGFSIFQYEISNNDDIIYRNVELKVDKADFLIGTKKFEAGTRLPTTGTTIDLPPHTTAVVTAIQSTSSNGLSVIYGNDFIEPISLKERAEKTGAEKAETQIHRYNLVIGIEWVGLIVGVLFISLLIAFHVGSRAQWKRVEPFLNLDNQKNPPVTE